MKDELFSGLVALLEDRFQEMDSDITVKLADSDTEYAALKARLDELESQFPFIEKVLEGKDELRLTAEQHAGFAEYMRLTNEAENIERMNLYLTGHRDCFAYLKRIGCSDDGRCAEKSRLAKQVRQLFFCCAVCVDCDHHSKKRLDIIRLTVYNIK